MTTTMTQYEMSVAFRALGCNVTPKAWDGVRDGQVVTTYGAVVSLSAMGSTETRTIREGEEIDPDAVVKELRTALASRSKRTRAAIRAERARS